MASRTIRSVEDIKKRARQVRERGRRAARRLADKDIDALTSDEAGKALGQATAEWVEASDKIRELMGVGSVPLETGQEPPQIQSATPEDAAEFHRWQEIERASENRVWGLRQHIVKSQNTRS